ncbi:DUF4139 domain-containing protein [candidate division KSB1 bacterium]|nr:DUF4139 domain-containing protein [candidate division KSB1 bacterium]
MKVKIILAFFLLVISCIAQSRAEIAVTVYNNNFAVVRETRSLTLNKGVQTHLFTNVAGQIDPTSVLFKSLSNKVQVEILEQNFEYDLVGTERLLQKYLNESITVTTKREQVHRGILLNNQASDIILQRPDGRILVVKSSDVAGVEFPTLPEGLITRPTLVWLLNANQADEVPCEISYTTEGIGWHCEYVAVSNKTDTALELAGWVTIENRSGTAYRDAKVKLVAGDVHKVKPPARRAEMAYMTTAAGAEQFKEEKFFEYHLYTLQRPTTIANNQVKQMALFPGTRVKSDKKYIYNARADADDVSVVLEFKNDSQSGLGIPLPKGKIRVFKEQGGSQEFVGEDRIDHVPKGEKVRLRVGNAFDIKAERTVKKVEKISDKSRRETVEINIRNHKDEDVVVFVVEQFWTDWQLLGDTPPIVKKDANSAEFKVAVAKNSESTFEYMVLYNY